MTNYTHKGWFGFVPVLIANKDGEFPELCPRWGLPDLLIVIQADIFNLIASAMGRDDWAFPIRITGRIK